MESAIFAEISMHVEDLRHDLETTGTNIHFLLQQGLQYQMNIKQTNDCTELPLS
jgi:hypothetical protein